jgi:hypothetical protein
MTDRALYVMPLPGADAGKYSHWQIYLLASEDLSILNLLDSDEPEEACRIARRNFAARPIAVFTDAALDASGCSSISELPVWARQLRLEFAIEEGSCAWLKTLPMGVGRDLFFQGNGAVMKWRHDVVAPNAAFSIKVWGSLRSQPLDCEVKLFVAGTEPPCFRAELTTVASAQVSSPTAKRFALTLRPEPDYLVPLFADAFAVPAVPLLEVADPAAVSEREVRETDLAALGMALGATGLMPLDPSGGSIRVEGPLYDLEARIETLDVPG